MTASEAPPAPSSTSTEPNLDSPWDALQICKDVVLGSFVDGWCYETNARMRGESKAAEARLRNGDRSDADDLLERWQRWQKMERKLDSAIRGGQCWSIAEVTSAAGRVEKAVQQRLWLAGGISLAGLDRSYGRSLRDAQAQANRAVALRSGQKAAREVRTEAAAGKPLLAICCGKMLRRLPEDLLRKHAPDLLEHYGAKYDLHLFEDHAPNVVPLGIGDGCFTIFVESIEPPRPPDEYCPRCNRKARNTMNAGLAKNARKRLRASRRL